MNHTHHRLLIVGLVSALVGCASATDTAKSVPAGLTVMEAAAEDAYDQSLAQHFDDVTIDAQMIDEAWTAFRSEAADDGAPTDDLTAMDAAVAGFVAAAMDPTDALVLGRSANAVSGAMDELYRLYDEPAPPEVLALDYLGREVVLDGRQGDLSGAGTHIDALESTFATIRAALEAAGGGHVATEYEASIAAMRADVANNDLTTLETDTNVGLELVDRMEGAFTKASQG